MYSASRQDPDRFGGSEYPADLNYTLYTVRLTHLKKLDGWTISVLHGLDLALDLTLHFTTTIAIQHVHVQTCRRDRLV